MKIKLGNAIIQNPMDYGWLSSHTDFHYGHLIWFFTNPESMPGNYNSRFVVLFKWDINRLIKTPLLLAFAFAFCLSPSPIAFANPAGQTTLLPQNPNSSDRVGREIVQIILYFEITGLR